MASATLIALVAKPMKSLMTGIEVGGPSCFSQMGAIRIIISDPSRREYAKRTDFPWLAKLSTSQVSDSENQRHARC